MRNLVPGAHYTVQVLSQAGTLKSSPAVTHFTTPLESLPCFRHVYSGDLQRGRSKIILCWYRSLSMMRDIWEALKPTGDKDYIKDIAVPRLKIVACGCTCMSMRKFIVLRTPQECQPVHISCHFVTVEVQNSHPTEEFQIIGMPGEIIVRILFQKTWNCLFSLILALIYLSTHSDFSLSSIKLYF